MSDDTGKMLVSRAEGYNSILRRYDLLPFDNSNEYTTIPKAINEQKMRQNYVAPNSFSHLSTYSHQTASKNVNEIIRTKKQRAKIFSVKKPRGFRKTYSWSWVAINAIRAVQETSKCRLFVGFPHFQCQRWSILTTIYILRPSWPDLRQRRQCVQ